MTTEEAEKLIDKHVDALMEHFNCVQILVTFPEEGNSGSTYGLARGGGDFYARQGIAREFVGKQQAQLVAEEISRLQ